MRLRAPAKINLHLRVGPTRTDGFHPLLSWMTTVSLFDTLTFRSTHAPGITLHCDDPKLPTDESNLVVKAARLLFLRLKPWKQESVGGVEITLEKRIPSGAGLGGGSSDAAATVIALTKLWRLSWTPAQLTGVAAELGSDVRFFFGHGSAICTSRGEMVESIDAPLAKWAMLILPAMHVSTPAVYKRFDELNASRVGWDDQPDWHQWAQLSARLLLPRLVNDLEQPAFSLVPDLGALRDRAEAIVDRPVRMSGSGSSLFTLFDTREEAESAAHDVAMNCQTNTYAAQIAPQIKEDPTKP
jgi:4-diphosphocytidyl-2-C-methyl-D-erythritol kinase